RHGAHGLLCGCEPLYSVARWALTGRYAIRTGLAESVIMPNDTRGLAQSEGTIAEALKPEYATALIGKWHLGHIAPYWPPTTQGFDLFFGLPYSHDMKPLSLYEANGPGIEFTQEDVDYKQLPAALLPGRRTIHRSEPKLAILSRPGLKRTASPELSASSPPTTIARRRVW